MPTDTTLPTNVTTPTEIAVPAGITMKARALLFDMDGTLVDSLTAVEAIWSTLAKRFGVDPATMLGAIHGVRAEDSVRRFAPAETDIEATIAEVAEYELLHSDTTIEIPGARDLITALPPTSVALVTSAGPDLARGRMTGAGIPLPHVVITADDVTHGKPSPEGYLLAAKRLGVEPADAIVFEDAEAGIQAGLAAGMRVIVIGTHTSKTTVDLPRITNHQNLTIANSDGTLNLTLPAPHTN